MVPYNYLEEEFKNTKNIFYEWKKLIKSTDYTLGRYIKKIENKICSYLGINYCIAVNNGTDGLILGLKSLDIKKMMSNLTYKHFLCHSRFSRSCGSKTYFCGCN